jgi:hypothetical protein
MRGVANEYISYAQWKSTYMTGVPGGYWSGKFLAVCDPEPPGPGREPRGSESPTVDRLLTSAEAVAAVSRELGRIRLAQRTDEWRRALNDSTPRTAALVQRLDRRDAYYYLSPLMRSVGNRVEVEVGVAIDAGTGAFLQATAVPSPSRPAMFRPLSAGSIRSRLLRAPVRTGELEPPLVVRPEAIRVHPALVWKPCRESLSPMFPFHMIDVGMHRVFVRVDGAVFANLTPCIPGM